MIKRLLLPVDNEDHMPPKEKPQPTEQQIALLHWWISNNADFTKKVKDLQQTDKIKPILLALQKATAVKKEYTDIPSAPVDKADEKIIDQLKQKGVVILPVAQNSNYLMANFITDTIVDKNDLQLLLQLKKQLIWLKLDGTNFSDDGMHAIQNPAEEVRNQPMHQIDGDHRAQPKGFRDTHEDHPDQGKADHHLGPFGRNRENETTQDLEHAQ